MASAPNPAGGAPTPAAARGRLAAAIAVALLVAILGVSLVAADPALGVAAHVGAGSAILVALIPAILWARTYRAVDGVPARRMYLALAALLLMAAAGGLLFLDAASPALAFLPLLPFAVLVLALLDAERRVLRSRPPTLGR